MKQYDVVVYRGRFQGMHEAHLKTILMGLQLAKKVIVVVGSANEPRTYYRNPFFENERIDMIRAALADHFRHDDVVFTTVEDHPDDNLWAEMVAENVQVMIDALYQNGAVFNYPARVGQIGYKKDDNCVRDVDLFPQWEYIDTPHFAPLDATKVREIYFSKTPLTYLMGVCPAPVIRWLSDFRATEAFDLMMQEKEYCDNYKKQFEHLEYAPTFVTGDNVPFQDDTILLVKRKNHPGKGLWAFAAGFFNAADRLTKNGELVKADKSVFDCAVRELFEETNASLTKEELKEACIAEGLFDAEGRDPRGRIVTQAYVYNFDGREVFSVEASDDAEEVRRFHISEVNRRMMYADHYSIFLQALESYRNSKYN
jgi:bifunctional NMN adenylyltransferase/nudix hydrolase